LLLRAEQLLSRSLFVEPGRFIDGPGDENRRHGVRDGACDHALQSICLRINVGISMSLRSCVPLSSGADRGARVRSLGDDGRPIPEPLTRAGRLAGKGITGEPFMPGPGVAASDCTGVTSVGCIALSNPVGMTVTRISPCI